jgi:hypothetical protein
MTIFGIALFVLQSGLFRWIGAALALFFFIAGLMMGSWWQLLPRSRPIGKRRDQE